MTLKTFTSGLLALALVALTSVQASAQTIGTGSTAIRAVYDSTTGNIKVQNTTTGTVGIQSYDIITLGNGTIGALSGQPGNVGFLSGSAALFPAFAFITSNTSVNGYNGLYSQAGGASVLSPGATAPLVLSPYSGSWSPTAPLQAGTYWDLGNVAITGMTQSQINTRFLTDPELTPPGFDTSVYGKFLVSYNTNGGSYSVTTPMDIVAVTPVPEPSTYAMAFAGLATCGFLVRRRRSA